jgi:hypothetical protein
MSQIGVRHKRNQIEFSVCRTSLRLLVYFMAMLNETDLYAPVKKLLEEQGYTVRAEIDRCDLVAVQGGQPPVIYELKRRSRSRADAACRPGLHDPPAGGKPKR